MTIDRTTWHGQTNKVEVLLQEKEERAIEVGAVKSRSDSLNKDVNGEKDERYEYTLDGSVDARGRPAAKGKTGGWVAGALLLGNLSFLMLK